MTDTQQTRDLVRRFYATYHSADRDAIEKLLSHDFRFTSPYDDAIDRATYFERCWSHAGTFAYLDVKELLIEGDTCFVLYEGAAANGSMSLELFSPSVISTAILRSLGRLWEFITVRSL